MALSEEEKTLIAHIDSNVKVVFADGGTIEDLIPLLAQVRTDELQHLISSHTKEELRDYCEQYKEFYQLVLILETLSGLSSK